MLLVLYHKDKKLCCLLQALSGSAGKSPTLQLGKLPFMIATKDLVTSGFLEPFAGFIGKVAMAEQTECFEKLESFEKCVLHVSIYIYICLLFFTCLLLLYCDFGFEMFQMQLYQANAATKQTELRSSKTELLQNSQEALLEISRSAS